MSDYILKFWPQNEVSEIKTSQIEKGLKEKQIIGESTEFWGKPAFKPGESINRFLDPLMERDSWYFDEIVLTISENDYGVEMGEEDFDYIDRNNVISIKGGDGTVEGWSKMCETLYDITGDQYKGGWEFL